ncbi:unnamed protein product [Mycena citricolor]|uniref:Uncharacterized protein n=1 Tax=Mycena citricolor TaxID=2018698 RepID=A0AAD2H6U6_9AGAR|nr:unnamed protein product [Mycena citricolor]
MTEAWTDTVSNDLFRRQSNPQTSQLSTSVYIWSLLTTTRRLWSHPCEITRQELAGVAENSRLRVPPPLSSHRVSFAAGLTNISTSTRGG